MDHLNLLLKNQPLQLFVHLQIKELVIVEYQLVDFQHIHSGLIMNKDALQFIILIHHLLKINLWLFHLNVMQKINLLLCQCINSVR